MNDLRGVVSACTVAGALLLTTSATAAEDEAEDPAIPPPTSEFQFALRSVTSVNGVKAYDRNSGFGVLDFSDTAAIARARTPLLRSTGRVGAMMMLTFPDAYYEPGTIFLGEAHAFYEDKHFHARLGRSRMSSRIIPFPTLRDDDFIRWSDSQNPFSDGRTTADHQFGNTAAIAYYPVPRLSAEVHAENLPTFVLRPATIAAYTLNSYGLTLGYRQIPALLPLSYVRQVGVGLNTYRLDLPDQQVSFDVLAGAWFNIVADPIHMVDLRLQAIYDRGVPRLPVVTLNDSFRTQQISSMLSIGYNYRRQMLPTFRTNVIGGYKRYLAPEIDQFSVAYNAFYALGVNADIGLQYQVRSRARIPEAFGDDFAHSIKLALVVSLETGTEPIFDGRESLLNVESGYLP